MLAQRVVVISPVAQDHDARDVAEKIARGPGLVLVARPQQQRQCLALEVDAGVDLRVPASLALSKSPFFRSLHVAASVLMDLDEAGVDDLETVVPVLLGVAGEQRGEDSLLRPAQMKAVNAVPFPEARRELVPLAAGDQNPPDPIECFSKIGRLSALFVNVRSRLGRVKLIFLGA